MIYAKCCFATANVMKHAKHSAELGTQLLFGEKVIIKKNSENWSLIESQIGHYEGWVLTRQLLNITKKEYSSKASYLADFFCYAFDTNTQMQKLIPYASSINANERIDDLPYIALDSIKKDESTLIDIATKFLNTPYMWGGRTHFGIDCSGFVQIIFLHFGTALKHEAKTQSEAGKSIKSIVEARCGDLLFFTTKPNSITHVGLYLGNNQVIHANEYFGGVCINEINSKGEYLNGELVSKNKLVCIKRIIKFNI